MDEQQQREWRGDEGFLETLDKVYPKWQGLLVSLLCIGGTLVALDQIWWTFIVPVR